MRFARNERLTVTVRSGGHSDGYRVCDIVAFFSLPYLSGFL